MGVTGARQTRKPSRREPSLPLDGYGVWALVCGVVVSLSFVWDRFVSMDGPAFCPFRRLTGIPCPACGLTRAFVSMGNCDPGTAWHMHALGPALWLLAALIGLHGATEVLARRRLRPPGSGRVAAWTGRVVAVAVLVYGLARAVTVLAA